MAFLNKRKQGRGPYREFCIGNNKEWVNSILLGNNEESIYKVNNGIYYSTCMASNDILCSIYMDNRNM